MTWTKGNSLKALAGGAAMTCVLTGSAAVAPVITAAAAPVAVAAVPSAVFGMPAWLPMRVPARVNCVRTNCPGPYHGDWAIDFIDTERSTLEPLYAAAPWHRAHRGTGGQQHVQPHRAGKLRKLGLD
jgi:hypothetical protein